MRRFCVLAIVLFSSSAHTERVEDAAAASGGTFIAAGAGANVGTPFGELQLGHRFHRAPHFELYLDYSYAGAISEYRFHTLGVGARTYFAHVPHSSLFHQALAAVAITEGGNLRAFGDRLLGGFFTQGLGIQVELGSHWSFDAIVSTGYPVWLRGEAQLRYWF